MTNRLKINFKGLNIDADIEDGVTLSEALREIAKSQDQLDSGDFETIEVKDE